MLAIFIFLGTYFFEYGCQPNNLWVPFIPIKFVAAWFDRSIVTHDMVLRTSTRTWSIEGVRIICSKCILQIRIRDRSLLRWYRNQRFLASTQYPKNPLSIESIILRCHVSSFLRLILNITSAHRTYRKLNARYALFDSWHDTSHWSIIVRCSISQHIATGQTTACDAAVGGFGIFFPVQLSSFAISAHERSRFHSIPLHCTINKAFGLIPKHTDTWRRRNRKYAYFKRLRLPVIEEIRMSVMVSIWPPLVVLSF